MGLSVTIPHLSTSFHLPFINSLPSPRLVNAFGDEVGWERVLKLLLVFKGVVGLGVRHAAALKPAVEHLCDPPQHALPTPRRDCQAVNAGQSKWCEEEGKTKKGGTIVKTNNNNNNKMKSPVLFQGFIIAMGQFYTGLLAIVQNKGFIIWYLLENGLRRKKQCC